MSRARYKPMSEATKQRRAANGGMNDTEAAFRKHMEKLYGCKFTHQPVTLEIHGGVKYTPDFMLDMDGCYRIYFEVKGSKRTKPTKRYPLGNVVPVCTEAARLRLKVAAASHPQHRFIMTWPNRGQWMEKDYSKAVDAAGWK